MVQRLVLVDDTNPNIQYSGPWFTAQNTQLNTGNFGPPFQNTLHGVGADASFSYSFSGSSIYVLGTSITTNSSGSQDPTWECFIDNNSIGWNTVVQSAENNWVLCQDTQLQDGPHVLTVKATVSNQQTFWFDEIEYLPSSSVPLDQAMMRISAGDPILQYSSGWSQLLSFVNITQVGGSTLTYQFSGVSSLSWFSYIPSKYPQIATSATYSIDGQSPSKFLVPASSTELYNQVLFQTGQLSTGQHTLVVTYQGNSGTAPLVLNYLVIQNAGSTSTSSNGGIFTQSTSSSPSGSTANPATNANNTASTSAPPSSYIATGVATGVSGVTSIISSGIPSLNGSSSSSSTSYLSSSTSTKPRLGAILGGALGGFILFLLLIIILLFKRRPNNQGAHILTDTSPPHTPRRVTNSRMVSPFRATPTTNHTLDDQSFTTRSFTSKFSQGRRVTDDLITSSIMRSTSPTDAPSPVSQSSAVAISSSSDVPLAVLPASGSGATTKAEMVQRSATLQGGYSRVLRYEDSGIRMPPGEENLLELPPSYSPG